MFGGYGFAVFIKKIVLYKAEFRANVEYLIQYNVDMSDIE